MGLHTTSQGRGGPSNVGIGAVTATLRACKFVNYISSGLSHNSGCCTVPHDQGSYQVWLAKYSNTDVGVVCSGLYSSLNDVFYSITFFLVSIMEGTLVVYDDTIHGVIGVLPGSSIFFQLFFNDMGSG